MPLDAWLPVGLALPDGARIRLVVYEDIDWQIFEALGGGHALVVKEALAKRWVDTGLIGKGVLTEFAFGGDHLLAFSCGASHVLSPVAACKSPNGKNEALAFADAMRATRQLDRDSALQDAIYVEKLSRLLPTYSLSARVADDVVLGSWLTGGVPISITAFRRLRTIVGWLGESHLRDVIQRAGFDAPATTRTAGATAGKSAPKSQSEPTTADNAPQRFMLAGRPELEHFINEHVIDIIEHQERYKALGIEFPAAIILHGPPGCGKTYAIERLVEYLGWPSFQVEASSVASPYIHETSKKVAAVFEQAMKNAPSVLVIDEMEAFLADRQMGASSSHHRVEEVAEFLRRIPEAIKNQVLIVAMTNRIEMIDPAILRRGRFDHLVKVDMASEQEVLSLLSKLVGELPRASGIDLAPIAKELRGRPLSDVAFVVREGARLAARSGNDKLDQDSLLKALVTAPARENEEDSHRKIGFV
jgi:hypothetical protein